MKNVAVLNTDNKIVYCAEWPEEPREYSICNRTGLCKGHEIGCPCEKYDNDVRQAIANGIEFNEQFHIKWEIWNSITPNSKTKSFKIGFDKWEMEKMKPYPLPKGINLEFKKNMVSYSISSIKSQPKEETQHDLWKEALSDYSTITTKFRIERIK